MTVDELRAENAALRAALKPFAAVAGGVPDNWPDQCPLTWHEQPAHDGGLIASVSYMFCGTATSAPLLAAYRRAAELLAGSPPPS